MPSKIVKFKWNLNLEPTLTLAKNAIDFLLKSENSTETLLFPIIIRYEPDFY